MPSLRSISRISLILAAACLAAGYGMAGRWIAVPFILLWLLAGLSGPRLAGPWLPPLLLAASVCLAGAGLLSGAPPFLMFLSAAASLAGWDLAPQEENLPTGIPEEFITRLRNRRMQSLAAALALGLLAASLGSAIRVRIPFGLMVLLVVLAFFALDRVVRGLKAHGRFPYDH